VELQDLSFPMDKAALTTAAADPELKPLLERIVREAEMMEVADIIEGMPESTKELSDVLEYDDLYGDLNFVQALLAQRTLQQQFPPPATALAELVIPRRPKGRAYLHHGSLTVQGNLKLGTTLIVLGDLSVQGRVSDPVDGTRLIVTGDFTTTTLESGGPVFVGRDARAKAMYLGIHSKYFVARTVRSELIVGNAESDGISGNVEARYNFANDQWRKDPKGTLEKLAAVLLPELMETDERDLYEPEKMLAQVEAGKPFLRG
jgi:hypothetical protein